MPASPQISLHFQAATLLSTLVLHAVNALISGRLADGASSKFDGRRPSSKPGRFTLLCPDPEAGLVAGVGTRLLFEKACS